MLAGGWQRNDVPHFLGSLPFHGERVSPLDTLKERMRAHDPRNTERSQVVGEIEESGFDFEPADIFTNIYGVFKFWLSKAHIKLLRNDTSERGTVGPHPSQLSNAVTQVIDEPITALRRTVGTIPNVGFRSGKQSSPVNDTWHPLGAA